MVKRVFDILLAGVALIFCLPLFAVVAIGISLSSPGPVFYKARRIGWHQREFVMYKFRTMHVNQRAFKSTITAWQDPRIFALGGWLRRLKIDELPQLINIIKGDMSIVGPRPEDPTIVTQHYTPAELETLSVRPGLSSPGSIYYYVFGEQLIDTANPEQTYVERLLPIKLALDLVYVREATLRYDLQIIWRTIICILALIVSPKRAQVYVTPEMRKAKHLLRMTAQKDLIQTHT